MRFVPALLLAIAALDCRADACDELPKPAVTLKRLEAPVALDTRHNHRALTGLAAENLRQGRLVLGLTLGNAVVEFALQSRAITEPGGRWECFSPQLNVSYGFNPLTVYVASEFPPGSCAYKEIYEHEQRHVKTFQAHLIDIEKDIAATLQQRFATGGPWRGPAGDGAEKLRRELDERWLPYLQREIRRVNAAQALIDTDAEYARLAKVCDGEVGKRLR